MKFIYTLLVVLSIVCAPVMLMLCAVNISAAITGFAACAMGVLTFRARARTL